MLVFSFVKEKSREKSKEKTSIEKSERKMARKGGATVTVATVNTPEEWGDLCSREVIHMSSISSRIWGIFQKWPTKLLQNN